MEGRGRTDGQERARESEGLFMEMERKCGRAKEGRKRRG